MAEAGRDEAFEAVIEEITRQQREAGMPFEDALRLERLIVTYGSFCAREARERAWDSAQTNLMSSDWRPAGKTTKFVPL
jgi:hypothetical protein